jgi:hypothetical protein
LKVNEVYNHMHYKCAKKNWSLPSLRKGTKCLYGSKVRNPPTTTVHCARCTACVWRRKDPWSQRKCCASCPLHLQSKDVGRRGWRMGKLSRVVRAWVVSQGLNLHRRSDWMTEKVSTFWRSNGAHGSTMHCASVPIQSQWGSVNGRTQWARGVAHCRHFPVIRWLV